MFTNVKKKIIFIIFIRTVADSALCLVNVPPNQPYDDYRNPGLFWNANDQCKMIYGPTASFCHVI